MRAELKLLKELGDLRDGILLAGALVYVAGYVVWSINSLRAAPSAQVPVLLRQLDLTRASLSQATAEALVPKASDEIGRSYRVSVYFVGNDELILRLRHRGKAFGRTFRVDNAAVQAVVGC